VRPVAYAIERAGAAKEIGVADGVAYPHGPDRIPFGQPPAVGYDFFLGPKVGSSTLGLTSFNKYINGEDPTSAVEAYHLMQGLQKDGSPLHVNNDDLQPVTTFQFPGDPVTNTGWLDSGGNDRRMQLSTGPFTMAPGDTQDVYCALIVGQGTDRLSSITDLKQSDAEAQEVFDLNFDIPSPPPSPSVYVHPLDKAIRLVFRTGAGEYWGIEETNMPQPPVLADRSFHRAIKGRSFSLYYTGSNLHMVVLRVHDKSYWVVNTLLDSLSNETMLAIATGLKPMTGK